MMLSPRIIELTALTVSPSLKPPTLAPFNVMQIVALLPIAAVFGKAPGCEYPLIVNVSVITGSGTAG